MNELIKIVKENSIDYLNIRDNSIISLYREKKYKINVIIGFKGRTEFIKPVLDSFQKAIIYYNNHFNINKQKICLTFVEHDDKPYHREMLENVVSYLWTSGNTVDQYSRSFAYNFGFKFSNKSKYYLLHDLDILVKENFFVELEENLKESKCIQTYGDKRVLYLSKTLTDKIINNGFNYNTLNESIVNSDETRDFKTPNKGSKGGSIMIERELFLEIGGFDPELFWGYAPEDQMLWSKLLLINGTVEFADNPIIDMFHMWHPPSEPTNNELESMIKHMKIFNESTDTEKLSYIKLKKALLKGIYYQ